MLIYACRGKHFKVYNSILGQVLEHPSDTEEVDLEFEIDENSIVIKVKGYIRTNMRIPGQKDRADIYILQKNFQPLLPLLHENINLLCVNHNAHRKWRYGAPVNRSTRQGVPKLVKLAEINQLLVIAPFEEKEMRIVNGVGFIDSEVPGMDQSKWKREGSSRQIHIGIGLGRVTCTNIKNDAIGIFKVIIPLPEIKYDFL